MLLCAGYGTRDPPPECLQGSLTRDREQQVLTADLIGDIMVKIRYCLINMQ